MAQIDAPRGFADRDAAERGRHFTVDGLYVRERKPTGSVRGVVLFIHGATVGSVLFDLPVPGYSILDVCAADGWWAFACDLRGYGHSSRPVSMRMPPQNCPLICTGEEAVSDIRTVAMHVHQRTGASRLTIAGGSWGSVTAARYAERYPSSVAGLLLLAPLFGTVNRGWLNQLEDPDKPDCIHPGLGGYRYVTEADLLSRWDAEISDGQTEIRRDPCMSRTIHAAEMAADPASPRADAFRAPNGTLYDLLEIFSGRSLYEPERLRAPTLLVRGAHDQTATEEDAELLLKRLGSADKRLETLDDGGHFMQAERCAPVLHRVIRSYLDRLPVV